MIRAKDFRTDLYAITAMATLMPVDKAAACMAEFFDGYHTLLPQIEAEIRKNQSRAAMLDAALAIRDGHFVA